jgi:hypothetical protein
MFQINGETYDQLKFCLKEILEQVKEIESINIDGKVFAIKKCFAGDLKFLATIFGINPANSDYPCLWCNCNLRNILDVNAVWPISRSHKEALERIPLKTKDQRQGYVREPLVDFVPFDSVLIDTLHLLLRITDKLFDVLFKKFDSYDKSDSVNLDKRPCLKKFLNYLEFESSITKPYFLSNGDKIKLRALSGSERLKFLSTCFDNDDKCLQKIFPEMNLTNENFVFKEFYELFNTIKLYGAPYRIDLNQLKDRLKKWLIAYSKLNDNDNNITPYVHAFVFHVPDFLRTYHDVNQFNMQGLEKLNDMATKYYHNSTNKKKGAYLGQLISKRNRIEFFNLGGQLEELDEKCPILSETEQINLLMRNAHNFRIKESNESQLSGDIKADENSKPSISKMPPPKSILKHLKGIEQVAHMNLRNAKTLFHETEIKESVSQLSNAVNPIEKVKASSTHALTSDQSLFLPIKIAAKSEENLKACSSSTIVEESYKNSLSEISGEKDSILSEIKDSKSYQTDTDLNAKKYLELFSSQMLPSKLTKNEKRKIIKELDQMILNVDGLSNIKEIESLIFPIDVAEKSIAFPEVKKVNEAEKNCRSGQHQVIESKQKKIKISDSQE